MHRKKTRYVPLKYVIFIVCLCLKNWQKCGHFYYFNYFLLMLSNLSEIRLDYFAIKKEKRVVILQWAPHHLVNNEQKDQHPYLYKHGQVRQKTILHQTFGINLRKGEKKKEIQFRLPPPPPPAIPRILEKVSTYII